MPLPYPSTPALCCAEGWGGAAKSVWLFMRPGLKPKEEWSCHLCCLRSRRSGKDPGSGKRFASRGPKGAAPSLSPPTLGIYSFHPQPFKDEVEF